MDKKRVVITGFGALTPIANNATDFWTALKAGKSGITRIDRFDTTGFSTQIAGMVKGFEPENFVDKKEARRTSRFILYGLAAAMEAVAHSGLDISKIANQVGVEVGSGIGGIEVLEETINTLREKGPARVSPFTVPMMIVDMAAGMIAMKLGAKGPNSCAVTACASSAHSMANAFQLIERGEALAMITGGAEAAITPAGLASFCAARSLSERNDEPEKASRPFDKDRDGFVMGEGAGILVFEELEHAKARGATIYAEVIGFGSTGDAYHITAPAPEGEGANRAMRMGLRMAKLKPTDVAYINAHGTSTHLNDQNETMAIKDVFGEHAPSLNISSIKSMTGHLLGAAGAIEAISTALTLKDGIIPPTINWENGDDVCTLNYTPKTAVKRDVNYAISNSFGFGGHNAVLVFKKYH
ncbi:MAG: beta-ketoacyl-ACP synthase II [Candidatus Margulisiibacteriota bacterium]